MRRGCCVPSAHVRTSRCISISPVDRLHLNRPVNSLSQGACDSPNMQQGLQHVEAGLWWLVERVKMPQEQVGWENAGMSWQSYICSTKPEACGTSILPVLQLQRLHGMKHCICCGSVCEPVHNQGFFEQHLSRSSRAEARTACQRSTESMPCMCPAQPHWQANCCCWCMCACTAGASIQEAGQVARGCGAGATGCV